MEPTLPKIHLNRNFLSDFDKAIKTEWIITNGLGGYASSTVLGINTRKYHGILVAAFNPPTDRRILLAKLDEDILLNGVKYSLGANEFMDTIFPRGHEFLSVFSLDPFPKYTYIVNKVKVEKTLFMPYGKNAVVVIYDVFNPHDSEIITSVFPLANSRHFQSLTNVDELNWSFIQEHRENKVALRTSVPLSTLILSANDGQYFASEGNWVRRMYFRVDAGLGYGCFDDHFLPGRFEFKIAANERRRFRVLAVAGRDYEEAQEIFRSVFGERGDIDTLHDNELKRCESLLKDFQEKYADLEMSDWLKWLVLAADSFVVQRKSVKSKSVIAGYHWFEDWGRDSLISLPGLTLVTGRFDDAKQILLTFRDYCRNGIIPNRFPDYSGDKPDYNTVDASLWYFNAVLQFLKYSGDFDFVRCELWDVLRSIIEWHVKGTAYDIHVDSDGLLAHGPQLTWMDAVIDSKAVTPRDGKAVEIQALWYNALKTMEFLAKHFGELKSAEEYAVLAAKTRKSFVSVFWDEKRGYLCDVVKDDLNDWVLRPNQIIATALDFSVLDMAMSKAVVDVVWHRLWARYGFCTVERLSPLYIGRYEGDWASRNKAYHNGTVWAWLTGSFVTSFLKVYGYDKKRREYAFDSFLKPLFTEELYTAGLGSIGEIFDGDEPHTPRGCISQAWSIAESLRTYVEDILLRRPLYEKTILESLDHSSSSYVNE